MIIDPETLEGDYAEAAQYLQHSWTRDHSKIAEEFADSQYVPFIPSPLWDEFEENIRRRLNI